MTAEPGGPGRPVRVLVVDDSSTVRNVLVRRLDADAGIEVVGSAVDGFDALTKIQTLHPDVITLDIEMPRLDGLSTLERLMRDSPTRVVMVSSLTSEGAAATIRALELGAVDFIEKPVFGGVPAPHAVVDDVATKIKDAARARLGGAPLPAAASGKQGRRRPPSAWLPKKVVIGSSTGGPQALKNVLMALPEDLGVPVVVVQHMPAGFTRSLAERFDELCTVRVEEAEDGSRIEAGKVLLAPGGFHMTIGKRGVVSLNEGPTECGVRPAINITMESMVESFGADTLGVILTGMGSDGTRGAGLVKDAGGRIITEAEETCVVWGMPRSIEEAGYTDRIVPLDGIAATVIGECLVGSTSKAKG